MAGSVEQWDGQPVSCELSMAPTGELILVRGPGCTPEDARQLCELVVTGYPVQDHAPPGDDGSVEAHTAA